MKKRIAAAIALSAVLALSVTSAAYSEDSYTTAKTAAYLSEEYAQPLSELNAQVLAAQKSYAPNAVPDSASSETSESQDGAEEVQSADFAALYSDRLSLVGEISSASLEQSCSLRTLLIDYDIALKKFSAQLSEYVEKKAQAEEYERLILTGEADSAELEAVRKETEQMYYDIKSALFDISVMKQNAEKITGETLKSDFDFESAYFITDALKLDVQELLSSSDGAQPDTICHPVGVQVKASAADITDAYNTAVQSYYSLGAALRGYVSAAASLKTAEQGVKLGTTSQSALEAAQSAKDAAYLETMSAKAEYSKALIALDKETGGAVLGESAVDSVLSELSGTIPNELSGQGLWKIVNSDGKTVFCPIELPFGIAESDNYSYTISYNGAVVGNSGADGKCTVGNVNYSDGITTANVTFYKNGSVVGTCKIDVFSPFGAFVTK